MEYVLIIGIYLVSLGVVLAFSYGAHKNDVEDYKVYESGSSPLRNMLDDYDTPKYPWTNNAPESNYIGLPIVIADDDFLEHLAEMGFETSIDVAELNDEWNEWAGENLE